MTYILRIDTSPRKSDSLSRQLADYVEEHLLMLNPSLEVRLRDLGSTNLPHVSNRTITGFYTAPNDMTSELKAATALSDELISELKEANTLIISAPMYNFGVPSGDFSAMNFLEPYLKALTGFLGIENIETIRIEGTTGDADMLSQAKQQALNKISQLFTQEDE